MEKIISYLEDFIIHAQKQDLLTVSEDTKKLYDLFAQLPSFILATDMMEMLELKPKSNFLSQQEFDLFKAGILKEMEIMKIKISKK